MIDHIDANLRNVMKGIASVDLFEAAVRAGYRRITSKYPLVEENLDTIVTEIRNTLQAIAMTASVVTHAKLVIGDRRKRVADTTRFGEAIDQHLLLIAPLQRQVGRVQRYREVIKAHAEAIEAKTGGLQSFAAFVSINSRRYTEADVADALVDIYVSTRFYDQVCGLPDTVELALQDVRSVAVNYGGSGDLPAADLLLMECATAFGEIESRANFAALGLDTVASKLAR